MAESEGGGTNIFEEIITGLFALAGEMISAFVHVLPTILKFILWVLSAVIILPCVFVAGQIYPAWVKWGEDF